jgi:hypothetical protein
LAILFRYASTHKGLTIYFAHQSFFDVMGLIKKMSNVYILWKPRARTELSLIEDRIGMPKDSLKILFKDIATGPMDSICVDMTRNSPQMLRLNVWKPIDFDPESFDANRPTPGRRAQDRHRSRSRSPVEEGNVE